MRWEQNCYPSSKDKLRANDSAQRRFHANKLCQPALSDSFIPIFQSQVISQNCQTFLYHIFKVRRSISYIVRLFYINFTKSGNLPNLSDSICQLLELSKSYKKGQGGSLTHRSQSKVLAYLSINKQALKFSEEQRVH